MCMSGFVCSLFPFSNFPMLMCLWYCGTCDVMLLMVHCGTLLYSLCGTLLYSLYGDITVYLLDRKDTM